MRQDRLGTVFPEIGAGDGLSWSWHLDLETLLAALSEPAPWNSSRPSAARPLGQVDSPDAVDPRDRPAANQRSEIRPSHARPGAIAPGDSAPGDSAPGDSAGSGDHVGSDGGPAPD